MAFADFDDSQAKLGCAPGVTGLEWFCRDHLEAAQRLARLPTADALAELQRQFGAFPKPPREWGFETRRDPRLVVDAIGPSRARVFAIVRQATGLPPADARRLLDAPPFQVAEGWPASFAVWQSALAAAGATVRIHWDD